MRRFAAIAMVSLAVIALPGCASNSSLVPACTHPDDSLFQLMAQSVPSATKLPCLTEVPAGWIFSGTQVRDGLSRFWLDSGVVGVRTVEVDLAARCDVSGAVPAPPAPDEAGTRVFVSPSSLEPTLSTDRFVVFAGGCVTYRFRLPAGTPPALLLQGEEALSFLPRAVVVKEVRDDFGLVLCGAGAQACTD